MTSRLAPIFVPQGARDPTAFMPQSARIPTAFDPHSSRTLAPFFLFQSNRFSLSKRLCNPIRVAPFGLFFEGVRWPLQIQSNRTMRSAERLEAQSTFLSRKGPATLPLSCRNQPAFSPQLTRIPHAQVRRFCAQILTFSPLTRLSYKNRVETIGPVFWGVDGHFKFNRT